jgi:hypothetical protein
MNDDIKKNEHDLVFMDLIACARFIPNLRYILESEETACNSCTYHKEIILEL